jgi:hypothetical protein
MALVDVIVDISDVISKLKKYGLRDRNVDMSIAAEALRSAMSDLIRSEGALGTEGLWRPLSPSTLRAHPNRIGGRLLQDTGLLANIQTRVSPRSAEAYSPAPYGGYHVTGTRKMPRRDFTAVRWGPLLDDIADSIMVEVIQG